MLRDFMSVALGTFVLGTSGCGSDSSNGTEPPAGACLTNGTATGSRATACNDCGKMQCNAELSDKAGSGWAQGYWGGDGACAAFNDCTCKCLAANPADPLGCATSTCVADMTPACQAAVRAADDCVNAKCQNQCR